MSSTGVIAQLDQGTCYQSQSRSTAEGTRPIKERSDSTATICLVLYFFQSTYVNVSLILFLPQTYESEDDVEFADDCMAEDDNIPPQAQQTVDRNDGESSSIRTLDKAENASNPMEPKSSCMDSTSKNEVGYNL